MKKKTKTEELYGIIGLGRFGSALARTLAEEGAEIIVVDQNEVRVRELREYTDNAYVTSDLSRESLCEMGIDQCCCVAICIGERIDTNILTSLNCVSLGVERVIAKAVSREHGEVLAKLNVEGVYPENDMAVRLARRLASDSASEYIRLRSGTEITPVRVGRELAGKRMDQADICGRLDVKLVAVERKGGTLLDVPQDYVFGAEDMLILIGKSEDIRRFEEENR